MSNVFTPTTDADALYGDGDWRPILGEDPRKADWKVYMIGKTSIEHKMKGIILPSFDWTKDLSDESFRNYVGPCWTPRADPHSPRHFTPNAFALPILMYPYMGENKEHWISPQNRAKMIGFDTADPAEFADAFDDLNKWTRKKFRNDEARKDFFLKAPSMQEDALIPGRSIRFASLAEVMDKENSWHKAVIFYTGSAHSYLIEQMRWLHQDEGEPRDPDFPQYMLGDPTNPKGALEWHVDKVALDPRDPQETNVLCFTETREFLDANQATRPISPELLNQRFLLPDPANWNIPTYEEQVRHMMESYDPAVTAEMIQAACGARCREEIPSERPQHIRMSAAGGSPEEGASSRQRTQREEPAGDPMAAATGGGFAPTSTPPQPDKEPAPVQRSAPPQDDTKYWTGKPQETPVQMTASQLQGVIDAGGYEGTKVLVDGKQDWRLIEDCGLVTIPQPEPEVPSVPDVPSVPQDSAPPAVPEGPPAVPDSAPAQQAAPAGAPATAGEGLSKEAFQAKLFPDFESLDQEKKAKATALVEKAWPATDYGKSKDMPQEIVAEMMEVLS